MSTKRLAYTPAIRRPRLPQHFAVGVNDGEMAFAVEPLQKQGSGIVPAAQWVDVPQRKCESAAYLGKKRHAPLFSCAGAGEGV